MATSAFIRRKATYGERWLHYAPALGPLAQLVEQGTLNPKVAGSIPARPIAVRKPARFAGHDASERLLVSIPPATAAEAGKAGIGGDLTRGLANANSAARRSYSAQSSARFAFLVTCSPQPHSPRRPRRSAAP